jgi:HK97 family phage portal protein
VGVIQSEGQLQVVTSPWLPNIISRGALRLYGANRYSADYATMYKTQPAVRTVVDFLAKNLAQLGLKVYRRVSDNEREHLGDHELGVTLRNPNPRTSRYRFWREIVTDRGIYDNAYAVKIRAVDNPKRRLYIVRVPASRVEIGGDNWLQPDHYKLKGGSKDLIIEADRMIHFRGYNPEDPRVGLSPLETLRRVLAEEAAAGEYRENFWKNAARIEGVLKHPGELTEVAHERLRAEFEGLYSGAANSGRTAILEEGTDFEPISFNAKDSQYIESRKLALEEVASEYHIMPSLLGRSDKAPYASIDAHHRFLYQDALAPWTVEFEEDIELQLLPEFDDIDDIYTEFNLAEKLKGSFEEQARSAQAAVGAPWITRNEQRARANLPPIDGGDDVVTPLNVLIGGQASPLDQSDGSEQVAPILPEEFAGLAEQVDAATALIRAGFEPTAALEAVGLDPIEHLGLVPVTVKEPDDDQEVEEVAKAYKQVVTKTLQRARDVVRKRHGANPTASVGLLFDSDRWTRELSADLVNLGSNESEDRKRKAREAASVINRLVAHQLSAQLSRGLTVDQAFDVAEVALFKEEANDNAA